MRRSLVNDLKSRQAHPHILKFWAEGWIARWEAQHYDGMMKSVLNAVCRILKVPEQGWVGLQPTMPIPDPMKVDARPRTLSREIRPAWDMPHISVEEVR